MMKAYPQKISIILTSLLLILILIPQSLGNPYYSDITQDGTINILDLNSIVSYFGGSSQQHDIASPQGIIDLFDAMAIIRYFGKTLPSINLNIPQNISSNSSVTINAVLANTQNITRVEFYNANTLLSSDTTQPYSHTVPIISTGTYHFSVQAYDSTGLIAKANKTITIGTITNNNTHSHNTNSSTNAKSFGIWNPSKWDTCTKAEHDSYFVIGPDGKKYPTWHPPQHRRSDGSLCSFGHEHGRDPKGSELWLTKQIQNYFYFDANSNGQMDMNEESVSGIPFGYANEQLDLYYASIGQNAHRHEDHVGHKIDYANGEAEIATHQMSTSTNGGVWVGKLSDGIVTKDTGARCYYLAKPHQGVSSPDAFTNNIHEVFYFADCRHPNPAYNQKISLTQIVAFGKAGGFTSFMPMCGIERRSSPQDFITVGTNHINSQYPNGPQGSDREIITRQCIEQGFLVPEGTWSGNLYEAWPAILYINSTTGVPLADGVNLLFDVEDANRYFYPESLKSLRGYSNPSAGLNLGFTMDLCYDNSLISQGRKQRGGPCEWATNYGQITNITWDDPRSAFKGVNRGMYFQPPKIYNAGGPEIWYSTPFGENAKTTPFPGSVKQQISAKNLDYSTLIGDSIDPRVNNRLHDDGAGTVHAPN